MKKFLLFVNLLIIPYLQAEDCVTLSFKPDVAVMQELMIRSTFDGNWEGREEWTYMKGVLVESEKEWSKQDATLPKMTYLLKKFDSSAKQYKQTKEMVQKVIMSKPLFFTYTNKMHFDKQALKTKNAMNDQHFYPLLEKALFHTFMAANQPLIVGESYCIDAPDGKASGFFTVKKISRQSVIIDFKLKSEATNTNDLPKKCKCEGTARFDRKNAYIHEIEFKEKEKLVDLFTKESKVMIRSYPKL